MNYKLEPTLNELVIRLWSETKNVYERNFEKLKEELGCIGLTYGSDGNVVGFIVEGSPEYAREAFEEMTVSFGGEKYTCLSLTGKAAYKVRDKMRPTYSLKDLTEWVCNSNLTDFSVEINDGEVFVLDISGRSSLSPDSCFVKLQD